MRVFRDSVEGSSPLARGTRPSRHPQGSTSRLIPARAGNTDSSIAPASVSAAHPRSRGEHIDNVTYAPAKGGSSPLARGTLWGTESVPIMSRLIPARAGNTTFTLRLSVLNPAHPRSRGEHNTRYIFSSQKIGSSPLARGTQMCPKIRRHTVRLIPARAGNTPVSLL